MPKMNIMKELEGTETWTNAFGERFGERVCVGVEKGKCIHSGKKFTPTPKEKKDLWEDHLEQELGPRSYRMKELDREFGTLKPKKQFGGVFG